MVVNTSWNYGIDWDTDPMGETALDGWYFIDPVNGSDSNDGSPTSPWATILYASNSTVVGDNIVLAKGTHVIGGESGALAKKIWGNQKTNTVLISSGINVEGLTGLRSFNNLIVHDVTFTNLRNVSFSDCILSSVISGGSSLFGSTNFKRCKFVNCEIYATSHSNTSSKTLIDCALYNSTVKLKIDSAFSSHVLLVSKSYVHFNSTLIIESIDLDTPAQSTIIDSNIAGNLVIEGTAPVQTRVTNINITSLGEFDKLQFVVSPDNLAIGLNNGYTSGLKCGIVLDSETEGYGVNPVYSENVAFSEFGFIGVADSGYIETARFDLGQLRKGFIIDVNGLIDYISTGFTNMMSLPKPASFQMKWSTTKGGSLSSTWYNFQFGIPPSLDETGRSNGQDNYNPESVQTLVEAREVVFKFGYDLG